MADAQGGPRRVEIDPERPPMDHDPRVDRPDAGVRELRLAVVCYGGVSLALYMSGITKEILKLVRASTALADPGNHGRNPFEAGTERVYWDLLSRIAADDVAGAPGGVSIRVVVDVISGTSAGGMNGVFLAKALAADRSQEPLRKLWFERGDIEVLLRGLGHRPRKLPKRLRDAWIATRIGTCLLRRRPPLRGDDFAVALHEALEEMDRHPRQQPPLRLVPEDAQLELFVPVTDFYGHNRRIALYDPLFVQERAHRQLMEFRHGGAKDQFAPTYNHLLAFAARATASFPGAFPPVSFESYRGALRTRDGLAGLAGEVFPAGAKDGFRPEHAQFIDGGVLDNFPFGSSIDAIAAKQAHTEVDRRLLYLEPAPEDEVHASPSLPPAPGILRTAYGGYAGLPRKEPIVDDLLRLTKRNAEVLRLREVIESDFGTIKARVAHLLSKLGGAGGASALSAGERLAERRSEVESEALKEAGFASATYLRIRVRALADTCATEASKILGYPPDSAEATLVSRALRRWSAARKLPPEPPEPSSPTAQRMLFGCDLEYHERRVRFLIAAVNWLYPDAGTKGVPRRAWLDETKERLYGRVRELKALQASVAASPEVREVVEQLFGAENLEATVADDTALERFWESIEAGIAPHLPGIEAGINQDVFTFVRQVDDEVLRGDLLTRYLGFPFWDVLVYPLQAVSDLGERDHVEVYRMSPRDARLLAREGDRLAGEALYWFGAFFDRPGREGDYLKGRLHAVERLVGLLLDVPRVPATPGSATIAPAQDIVDGKTLVRECLPAFGAVLAEEQDKLGNARPMLEEMAQRVDALGPRAGPGA